MNSKSNKTFFFLHSIYLYTLGRSRTPSRNDTIDRWSKYLKHVSNIGELRSFYVRFSPGDKIVSMTADRIYVFLLHYLAYYIHFFSLSTIITDLTINFVNGAKLLMSVDSVASTVYTFFRNIETILAVTVCHHKKHAIIYIISAIFLSTAVCQN